MNENNIIIDGKEIDYVALLKNAGITTLNISNHTLRLIMSNEIVLNKKGAIKNKEFIDALYATIKINEELYSNDYCDKISIVYSYNNTRVEGDYFPTECLSPSIDIWLEHPMSKKRIEELVIATLNLIERLGYNSICYPSYPSSMINRNIKEYSYIEACKKYVDTIMSNFTHRVLPADLYINEFDFEKCNKKIVKLYKIIQDENFRVKFLLKIIKRSDLSITTDMGYDMVYALFGCGDLFGSDIISDIEDIVYIYLSRIFMDLSRIFMEYRYGIDGIKFQKHLMIKQIIHMMKVYYEVD